MDEDRHKENEVNIAAQPIETGPAAGGAEPLERIFRDNHRKVYQAAYRITGNAMDAEDAVQTVFMRLVRRHDRTRLSENPGSYLHRAAVNASLDILRSKRTSRSSSMEEFGPTFAEAPTESPERKMNSKEIRSRIQDGLALLNPRTAEVFILRYFEGYGNHEIATMLGTSRSTIAVMLHRARHKLREELRSLAGEPS